MEESRDWLVRIRCRICGNCFVPDAVTERELPAMFRVSANEYRELVSDAASWSCIVCEGPVCIQVIGADAAEKPPA